jgi:biotin carboxylase
VTRVLLLLPTTSYRTADFLRAAEELGVEVTVASEKPSTMEAFDPRGLVTLDFRDPSACARRIAELARATPISAVVGVDEETAVAAAAIADALGLPHNPIDSVAAARDKGRMRSRLSEAGVPTPRHNVFPLDGGAAAAAAEARYPCVLKPTFLAASRGVIRADDPAQLSAAWDRIAAILAEPDVARRGGSSAREILIEEFVPGAEVALEGLLKNGQLRTLALFDKPDPLDGPFFEETIYVTPSRLPEEAQTSIRETAARGARALGLTDGPIHAELRWNSRGAHVIEIAARSIGGLCARTLRFGAGMSLEELILRHALGRDVPTEIAGLSSGVMMLPIPRGGILEEIRGRDEARAVPGIVEVTISAHPGQRLVPLPEGSRYLGFVFARADDPASAEAALREAHARLEFVITPSS